MTFRICLIILISIIWSSSAGTNVTILPTFIEKPASLARISATIAIHNGIFEENSTVQEVTSEFLEISPSVAKELLEHDYGSLSSSIQKFHSSLTKVSPEMKNSDELIETLNNLLDMKMNQEYLKPGTLGDQTGHFSRTTEIMKNSNTDGNKMMYTLDLITTVELLRNVTKSNGQAMKKDEKKKILTDLVYILPLIQNQLNLMDNYKTALKDYLSLESLSNDLQNVVSAARLARKYSETIGKLDPFRKDLIAASENTGKVEEAIKEIQKFCETIQYIFSTSIVLNSTVPKYEEKVLTHGLISHKDLLVFGEDFENPWFQKNVLSDLDPAKLKNGLENLKPFVDALETLMSIKNRLFDNLEEKKATLDLVEKIGDVQKLGSKLINGSSIKSTFEEVSACIEPLQPIQNPPDQAMLQRIVKFSANVVENVKNFSTLMDDINNNSLESIIIISKEVRENIEFVTETKNDSIKMDMWNNARKLEGDHKLADKLQSIADMLNDVRRRSFFLEDRHIDYNVIRKVSTVFEGTNVDSVLNCIRRQTLDNLIETLEFINRTHVLKEQETDFKTASNFIASISAIQSKYKEIKILVKICRLTTESYAMMYSSDLQRIQNLSVTIGRGVSSLRDLDNILKEEKSILSVTNAEIPNLDSSYQKKLATIPNIVENLLKNVESKPQESMKDLETLFATLSKNEISKLNIPTKFLMKIGLNLSNNSNPEIRHDFEIVSSTDMNFVKHSKAFGGIQGSLELTKESLAEFLKNRTEVVKPVKAHFIFFADLRVKDIVGIILVLLVMAWIIASGPLALIYPMDYFSI